MGKSNFYPKRLRRSGVCFGRWVDPKPDQMQRKKGGLVKRGVERGRGQVKKDSIESKVLEEVTG